MRTRFNGDQASGAASRWRQATGPFLVLAVGSVALATSQPAGLPGLVRSVQPSVVAVIGFDSNDRQMAQGSGFFVDTDGVLITARHVLRGAARAEVRSSDGRVFPITRVLGDNRESDLLRVAADIGHGTVHALPVSASTPEVGEQVLIIGSPLGLDSTVAHGIVSAIREIPRTGRVIQISAPISRGSSGSPVVNLKGEVLGVVALQAVEGQNLNFAVPADRIAMLARRDSMLFSAWAGAGVVEYSGIRLRVTCVRSDVPVPGPARVLPGQRSMEVVVVLTVPRGTPPGEIPIEPKMVSRTGTAYPMAAYASSGLQAQGINWVVSADSDPEPSSLRWTVASETDVEIDYRFLFLLPAADQISRFAFWRFPSLSAESLPAAC